MRPSRLGFWFVLDSAQQFVHAAFDTTAFCDAALACIEIPLASSPDCSDQHQESERHLHHDSPRHDELGIALHPSPATEVLSPSWALPSAQSAFDLEFDRDHLEVLPFTPAPTWPSRLPRSRPRPLALRCYHPRPPAAFTFVSAIRSRRERNILGTITDIFEVGADSSRECESHPAITGEIVNRCD